MPSFHIHSFGCRANQAEGAALQADLVRSGMVPATSADADWVVLNTCTVTATADAEARRAIRRLHRERPGAKILVTGCYAQRDPAALVNLSGVACVVGNAGKLESGFVAAAILGAQPIEASPARELPRSIGPAAIAAAGDDHTRPMLKVQDGCNLRCGYCVIPFVRGASRSLPLGRTLEQAQALVAAGAREIVLSGINLGQWGRDLDRDLRLPDLIRALLEQTSIERLRLSSIEPLDWSDDLIGLLSHPRIARHAHLPLQSGSDAVLRRMRRRYRLRHYEGRIAAIHAAVPAAAIGADVMVGFPGESEAEFEETRALIAALPFTYLHVFQFSSRPGTAADDALATGEAAPVPAAEAARRAQCLRDLIAAKRAAFLAAQVGAELPVITLRGGEALSDNFIRVQLHPPRPANQLLRVTVRSAGADLLVA